MKRVLVKSVHGAFGYVMEHYYPFGMADEAAEQGALTDTYVVISIQDSHTNGFGMQFTENQFCKGVLTLLFDDIVKEVDGAVLFDDEMADKIIDFIAEKKRVADTLLVHCYAGQSRSRTIGAFAKKMMGKSNQTYFSADKLWAGTPNEHVYNMLEDAWFRDMLG